MENQEIYESTQNKTLTKIRNLIKANKKIAIIVAAVLVAIAVCLIYSSVSKHMAYKSGKSAFENIDEAYNMTNEFSHDLYQAWYEGINNASEVKGTSGSYYTSNNYLDGLEYLVDKMNISFEDAKKGVVFAYYGEEEYAAMTEITDDVVEKAYENLLAGYSSTFSACVRVVTATYDVQGKTDEINQLLNAAKDDMKKMSNAHSDYVHYPDLKDYLTLTCAFFDFCTNPEGSFEQVVETFNNYRNESTKYYFALNYIFE